MIRTEPDGARSDSLSSSPTNNATVAELGDAQDLGSCGATRGGSSPSGRITLAYQHLGPLPTNGPQCVRPRMAPSWHPQPIGSTVRAARFVCALAYAGSFLTPSF